MSGRFYSVGPWQEDTSINSVSPYKVLRHSKAGNFGFSSTNKFWWTGAPIGITEKDRIS